jgi:aspartate/methionine/tyrosine aminotransferase
LNSYINDNQGQLSTAYTHACQLLKKHDIPYRNDVNAAFFLWVNLRRTYTENHPEALFESDENVVTKRIFEKLMERKVFLVHGEAAGSEEPGWFRLVFNQPVELVEEGIKRIADAIS